MPGLFYLVKFNAQYVGKLSRYFNQVVGDFGPHQTIQVFTSLSSFPPSTQVILAPPRVTRLSEAMEDGSRWLLSL
jgi:hypothetical protein